MSVFQAFSKPYISASYLSRIFYRFTGFHFREYVTVVRIREAQRLLAETQLQVQEVAGKMGFEHMSHFNRTFKRIAGITPLQYRKRSARD
ncbi:helix-turn-helix transcriptional regulator [Cohnella massiliensis]|uniref:helix-turn-helix transcriptional regulator n=1 Tax=Cohnella massiliensis TaxID=1816691 RepID=UPI001FE748D5|nr:helix-turn-helix transcriptional regulator [Cohnella massiliensis]